MSQNQSSLAVTLACFVLVVFAALWPRSEVQSSTKLPENTADFSWDLPATNMRQADGSDIIQDLIDLEDFSADEIPGRPELPVQRWVVKIPENSQPTIEILVHETVQKSISTSVPIAPAPADVQRSAAGDIIGGSFKSSPLASYELVPTISIEDIGTMAGQRLSLIHI